MRKNRKNNLRRLRLALDVTQKELAEMSGVNSVSISYYENGKYIPNSKNALKIAKALGCTLDDLFKENES